MSRQELGDIADHLLMAALHCGATAADVVVAESQSLEVGVRLGEIEKLKQSRQKHCGLRVFVDKRSAITSSSDFSRQALDQLAADTCALAKIVAADGYSGLPDAKELAQDNPDLDLFDPEVESFTPEQGIQMATEAEAVAMAVDPRITNSEGAECSAGTSTVFYAASNGFRGGYSDSGVSLSVVPVAVDNGSMQRDFWYSAQRHLAKLEDAAAVGRRAAERTLRRLGARSVSTCEVPVVFDPELASGLLRHLAGAISGYSLYKGTSYLIGKLGERIAPEFVTVIDDGRLPGRLGSKPFDGEGLPTRRNVVLEAGVLASYLFDTYSARRLDGRSTGNAARSVGSAPFVSPTNFMMLPGETSPEEIIRSVRSGLYVTELIGHGVNATTGDYSRGAVGIWIENGELAFPVEEVTIAGNLLAMFQGIEMVGNDLDDRHSVCAPTLKIGKMTVAGR